MSAYVSVHPGDRAPSKRLFILRTLGEALYIAGRMEESGMVWQELAEQDPTNKYARTHLGLLAARRGDRAEAERAILFLNEREQLYSAARIAVLLGDRQRALELGSRSQIGEDFEGLHLHPEWQALRNDPEFQAILRPRG